jgi:RHH-type proline utilization regulon transcriptional repressor/proline dehydrogenase/delta 1-pyrroline-5-carboxylate dehydrogenase
VLPGPVGERNTWALEPRGTVLCRPATITGLALQVGAALATGNLARLVAAPGLAVPLDGLPVGLREWVVAAAPDAPADAVLFEGDPDAVRAVARELAERPGAIVAVHGASREGLADGSESYPLEWLVRERSVSVNTAAAGGNASLMTIG